MEGKDAANTGTHEGRITTAAKGEDYLEKASDELAVIFQDDPVITYMLCSLPSPKREAYRRQYMHVLLKAAQLNSGIFQEASSWSCTAVWMPPGKRVDNWLTLFPAGFFGSVLKLGLTGAKRMLIDFVSQVDNVKKELLRKQGITRYWYLFFIGTRVQARGQGLASKVIQRWQERAATDGLPIWLEATTEKSREVYRKCGFEWLETIVLGKGSHGADGEENKGGEGVRLYAMVWRPEKEGKGGSC